MKEKIKEIRRRAYEKAIEIGFGDVMFSVAFGILALYIPLLVHEFGHIFMATLLGYKATLGGLLMFEGWTSINSVTINPRHAAVIALAGPIFAFAFGDYMWSFGKRTPERYVGLISWLISTLPNLLPVADGRDATYLINAWGYPITWLIFFVLFAYVWIKVLYEGVGPLSWVE